MDVAGALEQVVGELPDGGETRTGQLEMAEAVARSIDRRRHLVVQAGTGTGKSLAYLVPAVLSGKRVVVATATKALQDQLCRKDLPFLAEHLGRPFTFALVRGRSNYLCLQRAQELLRDADQLALDGMAALASRDEILSLIEWGTTSPTGDRSDLQDEPSNRAWSAVSVTARECPGASRCQSGPACFAERARDAAAEADVIVANTALYATHLASGGVVLPEHEVVVFDEAHQLEDIVADICSLEISPGRFRHLARIARGILADEPLLKEIDAAGDIVGDALVEVLGERLRQGPTGDLARAFEVGRSRLDRLLQSLRKIEDKTDSDIKARAERAVKATATLIEDLTAAGTLPDGRVAWVEGPADTPELRVAPIDVSGLLAEALWGNVTAVLTSATIPNGLARRVGLPAGEYDELDVGSPFDYQANGLLYCATHLPDPRTEGYAEEMHAELEALITAAGGRTLALFTSWRAMKAAADALRTSLQLAGIPVMVQGEKTKPALTEAFVSDEATCLFATMSFWQGLDVPGRSLSLVTVDKLPFPRPDEPLLQARRELARGAAFATIDLPRAATLLAQGAGRLIRKAGDRGVVAVFDPRLASARYRWDVLNALPPMRRTKDRAEVEQFLREITAR